VGTVAAQRHPGGVDRLAGGDRVAFDARDLYQPPDRITGQTQAVFHGNLRGVLHLLRCTAEDFSETAGRHGRSGSDLALAAHFSTGDGGALLVQGADRSGGQQEPDCRVVRIELTGPGVVRGVVQDRGDDPGRSVGGCSHDASARGVLLVDRQRDEVHPILGEGRIAVGVFGSQPAVPATRPPWHTETAG
jgi:hypothetical protein